MLDDFDSIQSINERGKIITKTNERHLRQWMNQERKYLCTKNAMAKTIVHVGRYSYIENVPADVGLTFQTHFHNNNLPNPQCLISHHRSMLMLIFEQGF